MVRPHRPRRLRLVVLAVFCWSMLLLRHNGGGVFAQGNGGGDDDDDDDGNDNTSSPMGAPTSEDDVSSEYPDCPGYATHLKDGYCDSDLNIASCGWDGGDCCGCTCGQGLDSADELPHPCGQLGDGYDCQDPDVPADCGVTPSPAASFGYPDCEGYMYDFQDSNCDDDLNNADCGWDGGDCCRCTCREYYNYGDYCGSGGYDCRDPGAPNDCGTDGPTPSPAAGSGYPGCEGYIFNIGDGYCDSYNNNEECGWDVGDCCICDDWNYNCLDPEGLVECDTDSPTPSPAAGSGYPGCEGYIFNIGDGDCHSYNNNEECGWDGGDCCTCNASVYDCLDPSDSWYCATPSPTVNTRDVEDDDQDDYRSECEGLANYIGDGECNGANNNSECQWDGGDCCSCDCDVGEYFPCGNQGYNCLDPSSLCEGSFSSGGGDSTFYGSGSSADPADSAASVQDMADGSSGSSFSGFEMAGVFVLSVSAFFLSGWVVLAAFANLRPRWCCFLGNKGDASAAAASKRRRSSRRKQHQYSSTEAVDRALTANRTHSSAAAPAVIVEETTSTRCAEADVVGVQESKDADEAELGGAFYVTGGTSASQPRTTEEGGNDGEVEREEKGSRSITTAVAGAGNGDDLADEEKAEEEEEEEEEEKPREGAAVEGGDEGTGKTDGVIVVEKGEGKETETVDGSETAGQAGSTEGGYDGEVERRERESRSTPAVAGGGNGDGVAEEKAEEENDEEEEAETEADEEEEEEKRCEGAAVEEGEEGMGKSEGVVVVEKGEEKEIEAVDESETADRAGADEGSSDPPKE